MAKVFISHARADDDRAARIRGWLVDAGHEVFLDLDPRDGIAAGQDWERRLHERLRWADAVVCMVTSAYARSVWCAAEVGIARARGSRLLPVLAEPDVAHPLLRSLQHVDASEDETGAATRLAEALRRIDAGGGSGWPDDRSPFPGLRPFDTDRHRVFFGRNSEVAQLAELLRSPAERASAAALLVVGPSGCGKSSLVRAGLLPAMAAKRDWWVVPALVPGRDPVVALTRELATAARQAGLDWTVSEVRERLGDGLAEAADELLLAVVGTRRRQLLVIVDQMEELLTQTAPVERARFADLVSPALGGPVQLVATLRPEFLDQMLVSPELAALPKHVHPLEPLRHDALRATIEGPARMAGFEVDDDLVAQLVADTASGEALPLLAYTLAELADRVPRGGRLLRSRYEQLGGVQGALRRQADAALVDALSAGGRSRDEVVSGLLRLVTVDEQGHPTRWRVHRDELPEVVAGEMDAFVARRLLTTDTENGRGVVNVAHEAFLSGWPPLAEAVTAASSALRARRGIEQAAEAWEKEGHGAARLWERGQLAAALADTGARLEPGPSETQTIRRRRWPRHRTIATDRVELSPRARKFLATSVRRDRRRRRLGTTVLSVLLVLALTAAGVALVQQRDATRLQRLAVASQLAVQADATAAGDPGTALLLGLAARQIHPDGIQSSLISTLAGSRYAGSLASHTSSVSSLEFSPTAASSPPLPATGPSCCGTSLIRRDPVGSAADDLVRVEFAPDGRTLATGSGTAVTLWDVSDPRRPSPLGPPFTTYEIGSGVVRFAPDGRTLATTGDGGLMLWDLDDPARPTPLGSLLGGGSDGPNGDGVNAVAFSPNGRQIVAGDLTGMTVRWDITDRSRPRQLGAPLTGLPSGVSDITFAPDGRTLVTAFNDSEGDGGVILWDVTDPTQARPVGAPLTGQSGGAGSVGFTPGGTTLLVGDEGNVVRWDVTDLALARLGWTDFTGPHGPRVGNTRSARRHPPTSAA